MNQVHWLLHIYSVLPDAKDRSVTGNASCNKNRECYRDLSFFCSCSELRMAATLAMTSDVSPSFRNQTIKCCKTQSQLQHRFQETLLNKHAVRNHSHSICFDRMPTNVSL